MSDYCVGHPADRLFRRAARLESRHDVGSAEIVSLEEKRGIKTLGQRIGDTITQIQFGRWVDALSIGCEGREGPSGLSFIGRYHFWLVVLGQGVEIVPPGLSIAAAHDHQRFE